MLPLWYCATAGGTAPGAIGLEKGYRLAAAGLIGSAAAVGIGIACAVGIGIAAAHGIGNADADPAG